MTLKALAKSLMYRDSLILLSNALKDYFHPIYIGKGQEQKRQWSIVKASSGSQSTSLRDESLLQLDGMTNPQDRNQTL